MAEITRHCTSTECFSKFLQWFFVAAKINRFFTLPSKCSSNTHAMKVKLIERASKFGSGLRPVLKTVSWNGRTVAF